MQASTRTIISNHSATIYMAIELSMKGWLVVMHSPDQERLSRYKLVPSDAGGLLARIAQVRTRAARALG